MFPEGLFCLELCTLCSFSLETFSCGPWSFFRCLLSGVDSTRSSHRTLANTQGFMVIHRSFLITIFFRNHSLYNDLKLYSDVLPTSVSDKRSFFWQPSATSNGVCLLLKQFALTKVMMRHNEICILLDDVMQNISLFKSANGYSHAVWLGSLILLMLSSPALESHNLVYGDLEVLSTSDGSSAAHVSVRGECECKRTLNRLPNQCEGAVVGVGVSLHLLTLHSCHVKTNSCI